MRERERKRKRAGAHAAALICSGMLLASGCGDAGAPRPDAAPEKEAESEAGASDGTEGALAATEGGRETADAGRETESGETDKVPGEDGGETETEVQGEGKSGETETEGPGEEGGGRETEGPGEDGGSDAAAPSVSGALQVCGTALCDSEGRPVQLRGISTHGLAWYPEYVNEACFGELRRNWNMNVIRLALYTAEYGGYCEGGDKEQLRKLVCDGIEYARARDLYVIVDWHILSDSNPNTYCSEAKEFFAGISAEYRDADHILYEICNEPNGGTGWEEIASYAREVIPVIRANDPDAVILVGTPNWSQYVDAAAAAPLSEFDNVMYTLHFYAATHREDLRERMKTAVDAGLPVFVSEFGICDASGSGAVDEAQADAWTELMDAYGISYVAWNLSNKNETSAILAPDCQKTEGFTQEELSASGRWLYRTLTE
jgi:endoglucanase